MNRDALRIIAKMSSLSPAMTRRWIAWQMAGRKRGVMTRIARREYVSRQMVSLSIKEAKRRVLRSFGR